MSRPGRAHATCPPDPPGHRFTGAVERVFGEGGRRITITELRTALEPAAQSVARTSSDMPTTRSVIQGGAGSTTCQQGGCNNPLRAGEIIHLLRLLTRHAFFVQVPFAFAGERRDAGCVARFPCQGFPAATSFYQLSGRKIPRQGRLGPPGQQVVTSRQFLRGVFSPQGRGVLDEVLTVAAVDRGPRVRPGLCGERSRWTGRSCRNAR